MGLCGSTPGPASDPRKDWEKGVPVYVNVYDLQHHAGQGKHTGKSSVNGAMGLGVYHSGVQVFNAEYAFGGDPTGSNSHQTGVFSVAPKTALPSSQFYKQHLVGHLPGTVRPPQVVALVNSLKADWPMSSYHLVKRNCNHFSDAFLAALDYQFNIKPVEESLAYERSHAGDSAGAPLRGTVPARTLNMPAYINRAARVGSYVAPNAVIRALQRRAPPGDTPSGAPDSQAPPSSAPPPSRAPEPSEDPREKHPLPTSREALSHLNNRELKTAMFVHGVSWEGCVEKSDFVDAVIRFHQQNGTATS